MFRSFVAALCPWLMRLFYSFAGLHRRNRFPMFRLLLRVRSEVEKIINGMAEILLAAEVAFRGLDRCMPEQELNLLQLTAAVVTQFGTSPAQVVWCDVL